MIIQKTWKNGTVDYMGHLRQEERSENTISQYYRDILCFLSWVKGQEITKNVVIRYKEKLQAEYKATSVNAKLAALNGFFNFLNRSDLKVKQLKIQHSAYCSKDRELTKDEYLRLVNEAKRKENEKLSLLIQTICSTGIRVSELRFITTEAVKYGEAAICLKGKNRIVLLPDNLCRLLKKYIVRQRITTGPVFVTRTGKPLDRSNICKQMKALCKSARVDRRKVFPHSLRHLFARCFYSIGRDIAKLADILGHNSINTTRIYIVSTGTEHLRQMESLGLIV